MSQDASGATKDSSQRTTRCPVCWYALPVGPDPGLVRCEHCGRIVDPARAVVAHEYSDQAVAAAAYASHVEQVAAGWRRVAEQWRMAAERAAHDAVATGPGAAAGLHAVTGAPATASAPGGWPSPVAGPPPGSGTDGGSGTERRPPREIPTAVLLQGTGAVLILAAVVIVSAVAWTVLPPLGQVALLAAVVLVLGTVTIATRRRVPTTSLVLAALTGAVYVVVALTIPSVQPQLATRWYPFAAAALGSALLLGVGTATRISLWRHLGIASLPVTALLLPPALFDVQGPARWSLAALVLAAQAAALAELARRQRRSDLETATTALWSAIALAVATGLATAVAVVSAGFAGSDLPQRLWPAAAVLGAVGLLVVLSRLDDGEDGRSGRVLQLAAVALAPAVVTIVTFPPAYPDWLPATVPAGVLAVELAVGGLLWRAFHERARRRSLSVGWMWGAAGAALTWGWLISGSLLFDATAATTWLWLAQHATGLVLAAGGIVLGLMARSALLTAGGTSLAAVVWLSLFVGGHLGTTTEVLWLPIAAALLLVGSAARPRWPQATIWRLPWRAAVLMAAGVPTFAVALTTYAEAATPAPARIGLLLALAGAAVLVDRRSRGAITMVVFGVTIEAGGFAVVALAQASVDVVEPYALVAAAATALTLLAARHERFTGVLPAAIGAAVVLGVPSLVMALIDPQFTAPWAVPRGVAVLAVLLIAAGVSWRRNRRTGAAFGSAAIVLLTWWYVAWLASSTWTGIPEAWTIPLAAAATAVLALWTAAAERPAWWPLALPAMAALVVSSLVSLGWVAGSDNPAATLRAGTAVAGWWVLVWIVRARSWLFGICLPIAVFLTWFQTLALLLRGLPQAPFELYTWTAAAAVALGTGLAVWRFGRVPTSLLWLAPTVSLVLLPTALAAWSGGTAGWRVWFTLVAAAGLLAVGVIRKWAGAVWPALVALACVVVPVITKLSSDAPAWVPLALVGTALLALGARFESLRRQGRSAAHWAASLH